MSNKLIKVENLKGGKIKFEFFQLAIFQMLIREFGFSCIKFEGKEKYLKSVPGGFKIVGFQKLRETFKEYLIVNFDIETLPKGISHENLLNKYYQSNPITKGYAREFFKAKTKLEENEFKLEGDYLNIK